MRLDDMCAFARVAELKSFTAAARELGMSKQTLSRRLAQLEEDLGVPLLHRTTRRLQLTEAGAVYAERCAELARLADEANQAVTDRQVDPRGLLRVTADPVFGEAFLSGLVIEYAERWPEVTVEVVLTRRRVDLLEEGFDAAFRVGGAPVHAAVSSTRLGPARVRYCASPDYLARAGMPETPAGLAAHACIVVTAKGAPVRWPFRGSGGGGPELVPVSGRLRANSLAMAHAAVCAGLGIGLFPEFTCADDLRAGRLVSVLEEHVVEVGGIWLLHPTRRYLAGRVRAFVELAVARLAGSPWEVGGV